MVYQCIYCKATYNHDSSYKHNAYECPKQQSKTTRAVTALIMGVTLASLVGCSTLEKWLGGENVVIGANQAEIVVTKAGVKYKFICDVKQPEAIFTNCREVQ